MNKRLLSNGIFLLIMLCVLQGCKSGKSDPAQEFEGLIRKHINDAAFKNNSKTTIYELRLLKLDTIDSRDVDTAILLRLIDLSKPYEQLMKLYMDESTQQMRTANLYSGLGNKTLVEMKVKDAVDSKDKAGLYYDTVRAISRADSLVRDKIIKTKGFDTCYQAKVWIKATYYTGNDSSNTYDSLIYRFNKNKQVINYQDEVKKYLTY